MKTLPNEWRMEEKVRKRERAKAKSERRVVDNEIKL